MKLEEFVKKIYDERAELSMTPFFDPILNSKVLEEVKDELLKFDVFSECDDLEIVHFPAFKVGEDKTLTAQTYKYSEGIKFKGKCYLYSISLTPELYDPSKMLEPVKNGAAISPAIYNPMTFEPTKHILLTWSPEMAQDISLTKDETTLRNDIHKLLDDVLDNPEEYRMKGTRHIMLRGVFEIVNDERKFEPNYLVGNTSQPEGYIAYYMVKGECENNRIKLALKQKTIPSKLKDKFIEKFNYGGEIKELSEEEINQFLEENK
jgi:hypothetical protein